MPNHALNILRASALLAATFSISACMDTGPTGSGAESSTPAPATSSAFPFPPITSSWDAAVALSEQQQAAAELAIRTRIMISDWTAKQDPRTPAEILAAVSSENKPPWVAVVPLSETGGRLFRAVAVHEISTVRWEVAICRYDTPGVYSMGADGRLTLSTPKESYSAVTSTVALTTEANGAGEMSVSPRLLVVDSEPIINDDARRTCEPFRPDPFVQQPPQPISPGK